MSSKYWSTPEETAQLKHRRKLLLYITVIAGTVLASGLLTLFLN